MVVNTEICHFGSKGRCTCNYVENEPMVKIKQFWVVIFVLAKKTAKDTSNYLENQRMVKIKQIWVVIPVLDNKGLKTCAITWKISRWLK